MPRTVEYKIIEGSLQERFLASVNKVQFFGGGFANGKTSAACIKTIKVAQNYPGANILMARSTYPKLNDTLRKEMYKWMPANWVKRWPTKDDNTMILHNGTTINFRYVSQQGKSNTESTTSNLLSATYDLIVVDQIEDPEFVQKDLDDLLGRLRGSTPYDPPESEEIDLTMPLSGPRWMIITSNPTRNWVYRRIIRPYHRYKQAGEIVDGLLCSRKNGEPILNDNGEPNVILDVFEGSTYENKENIPADFLATLEDVYQGTMRERFLMGEWGAYEGLVYPQYNESVHSIKRDNMIMYLEQMLAFGYEPNWIEGYDHGLASPSCYLLGFVDPFGIVHIIDGFYKKELVVVCDGEERPKSTVGRIHERRSEYFIESFDNSEKMIGNIRSDPAIFKRTSGAKNVVGKTTAELFRDNGKGVRMIPGNNAIENGIIKVGSYLNILSGITNPYTGKDKAPAIYFASELEFIADEFNSYYWAKDTAGEYKDKPSDGKDHAMDTIKYLLSKQEERSQLKSKLYMGQSPLLKWHEQDFKKSVKRGRYGRAA